LEVARPRAAGNRLADLFSTCLAASSELAVAETTWTVRSNAFVEECSKRHENQHNPFCLRPLSRRAARAIRVLILG
jgi:hypothetical protein